METTRNGTSKRLLIPAVLVLATALIGAVGHVGGKPAPTFTASRGGPVTFTGTLDRTAVLQGSDGIVRMELVIGAEERAAERLGRVPTDLMVILDRSGSMSGTKMAQARAAIAALIERLGPNDRFALVTYANVATLAIPFAPASGRSPSAWLQTVAAIGPQGGTNMASGLDLGLDTVEALRSEGRVPRVILVSDGLANQGDASREGLMGRAGRAARGEFQLTTVGVGADFNEYLMTALADAGTGNYYYLESARDLENVFAREFEAARTTVASGLAVTIEPAGGVRVLDAAGYPLEPAGDAVTFRPGALFGGQERRVWVTLAVPTDTPTEYALGRFSLSYTDGGEAMTLSFDDAPRVACVANEDAFVARIDRPKWERSVIVEELNELRASVARKVKEGRRDEADQLMDAAIVKFRAMNALVQSPKVARELGAIGGLKSDVAEAFSGAEQEEKRNRLSKEMCADAIDGRRAGSKR